MAISILSSTDYPIRLYMAAPKPPSINARLAKNPMIKPRARLLGSFT